MNLSVIHWIWLWNCPSSDSLVGDYLVRIWWFNPGQSPCLSTISLRLQVSVSAHQPTRREHLSNYTKVALMPFLPRSDQMTPLSLPSVPAYWRLADQKQHRLWHLCDFAGTAGHDALSGPGGPTSHMTLCKCENAVNAWMLSWVSHNLWEMSHHFLPKLGVENWLSRFGLKSWQASCTTVIQF